VKGRTHLGTITLTDTTEELVEGLVENIFKEIKTSGNIFYKPIVISDISCDYTKPNNPIKIYNESSTWENTVISPNKFVDVISIDNLPSLIPKESSDDFSNNLTKLHIIYKEGDNRNEKKFFRLNEYY
jgi:hypothetical protein